MDARIACGIQTALQQDELENACAYIPQLWGELSVWKKQASYPFDECSLELAVPGFDKYFYACLILRPAYPKNSSAHDIQTGIEELKTNLTDWAKGKFRLLDPIAEDAPLTRFPVWETNLDARMGAYCFGKKSKKSIALNKPLVWYPELTQGSLSDLFSLADAHRNDPEAGISFEMHSLPRDLCRKASKLQADPLCTEWLHKIAGNMGILSRLVIWGSRPFLEEASDIILRNPGLQSQKLGLNDKLIHYLVFDPWAFEDQLPDRGSQLGECKYALTYDELEMLFCSVSRPADSHDPAQDLLKAMPEKQSGTQSGSGGKVYDAVRDAVTSVVKETIGSDLQNIKTGVDKLQSSLTDEINPDIMEIRNGINRLQSSVEDVVSPNVETMAKAVEVLELSAEAVYFDLQDVKNSLRNGQNPPDVIDPDDINET